MAALEDNPLSNNPDKPLYRTDDPAMERFKNPGPTDPATGQFKNPGPDETADQSKFCFRDTHGFPWNLKLNLAIARRIDSFDFSQVTEVKCSIIRPAEDLYREIFTNTGFRVALIWAIVQDQVAANINGLPDIYAELKEAVKTVQSSQDESEKALAQEKLEYFFVAGFDGEVIDRSKEALIASLADFIPSQKNALQNLLLKEKKAQILLERKTEEMDKMMDNMIEKEIDKRLKEASSEFQAGLGQ